MNTTIHLRGTPHGNALINAPYSTALKSAFVQACLNLDTALFAPFIDDDEIFQDKNRIEFLESLRSCSNCAGKKCRLYFRLK